MSGAPLRLGTRRSPMAVAQSQLVGRAITARTGREVELVGIDSAGDASRELLTQIGGTGVFVSALRSSLLAGEVDFAVHSLKDLPTGPAAGITPWRQCRAGTTRATRWSAGTARSWPTCRPGATIGTGSPRRAAQLLLLRPDIRPVPVRGNAGTRLAKVETGELDAVVLAHAGPGQDRTGSTRYPRSSSRTRCCRRPARARWRLSAVRAGKTSLRCSAASTIRSAGPRRPQNAALLGGLQAGCAAPVGAYAAGTDVLRLRGVVVAADGGMALRGSASGALAQAELIGRQLAADLLSRGAGRYMAVSGGHLSSGDDDK